MSKTCSSSKENLHFSKKQLSTTKEKTKAFDEASEASKSSKFPNFLKVMNTSSVNNKFLVVSFCFYFLLLFCLIVVSTYYKANIDIFTVHSFWYLNICYEFIITLMHCLLYLKYLFKWTWDLASCDLCLLSITRVQYLICVLNFNHKTIKKEKVYLI